MERTQRTDWQVSLDKAIAPLVTAGGAALVALLTGGVVDVTAIQGALITLAAGLATAGLVYFVRYNERHPNKALAALLPLAVAAVHAWQTGEINSPEILLAAQAVIGAVWTFVASRLQHTTPEPPIGKQRIN